MVIALEKILIRVYRKGDEEEINRLLGQVVTRLREKFGAEIRE